MGVGMTLAQLSRLQVEVLRLLVSTPDVIESPPSLLERLCHSLGCETAALWTPEDGGGRLRCSAVTAAGERQMPDCAVVGSLLESGAGLPGCVWASGRAEERASCVAGSAGYRSAAFPILFGPRVLGVVELRAAEPAPIGPDGLEALEGIGATLGCYLERHRAAAELEAERRARRSAEDASRRMVELQEVTAALSGVAGPQEIIETVVRKGLASMGAESGSIALFDGDGSLLEIVAATGYRTEFMDSVRRTEAGKSWPLGEAVHSGVLLWFNSLDAIVEHFPLLEGVYALSGESGARVFVPLQNYGRTIGGIAVTFREPRESTPQEREFVLTLARQCAQAVERWRLYDVERRARADAEAASRWSELEVETSAVLASSCEYVASFQQVARLAVPLLADWCIVDLLEEERTRRIAEVNLETGGDTKPGTDRAAAGCAGAAAPAIRCVLESGCSAFFPEIDTAALGDGYASAGRVLDPRLRTGSAIILPLRCQAGVIGAITFVVAQSGRRYSADDLARAEDLGRRAALAIDNARLYAEARDLNRVKDEFLATVSHELRTPLNSVLGWARLLRTRNLGPEEAAAALATIERNARAQAQIIDEILDVSRIITGKLRLDVTAVDLLPVVEAAVDTVRPAAEARGIRLEVALSAESGPVRGDADRLQQVAWNLLSNAIKFTPEGGRVEVKLERNGPHASFMVRDNGRGIAPGFLPHVFDRFRQADSSTARRHSGLGLGLAIVRHLVELHGGSVTAASGGEGMGATFSVMLPVMAVRADAEERRPPAERLLDRMLVLLVDDDSDSRLLLSKVMEEAGASVVPLASGANVLDALGSLPVDVLLSDIELPGEDGYSVIRKVRAFDSPRSRVPAVALTAYAGEEHRRRALAAGFDTYLTKPADPAELVAAVSRLAQALRPRAASR